MLARAHETANNDKRVVACTSIAGLYWPSEGGGHDSAPVYPYDSKAGVRRGYRWQGAGGGEGGLPELLE